MPCWWRQHRQSCPGRCDCTTSLLIGHNSAGGENHESPGFSHSTLNPIVSLLEYSSLMPNTKTAGPTSLHPQGLVSTDSSARPGRSCEYDQHCWPQSCVQSAINVFQIPAQNSNVLLQAVQEQQRSSNPATSLAQAGRKAVSAAADALDTRPASASPGSLQRDPRLRRSARSTLMPPHSLLRL